MALARQWRTNGCGDFTTLEGWTTDEKVAFGTLSGRAATTVGRNRPCPCRFWTPSTTPLTMDANAEIRSRWCKLLLSAGAPRGVALAVDFVTCQGRMKFVRPLYRALRDSPCENAKAFRFFLVENADFYRPICRKMVASDLGVDLEPPVRCGPAPRGRGRGARRGRPSSCAPALSADASSALARAVRSVATALPTRTRRDLPCMLPHAAHLLGQKSCSS